MSKKDEIATLRASGKLLKTYRVVWGVRLKAGTAEEHVREMDIGKLPAHAAAHLFDQLCFGFGRSALVSDGRLSTERLTWEDGLRLYWVRVEREVSVV
jgi:hypothetical protein